MPKILQILQIIKNMGVRYALYRLWHELEKRTGVLKRRHPADPPKLSFISLAEWRKNMPLFVIQEREKLNFKKRPNSQLKENANRILQGEIPFFSSDWKNLGMAYDWVTNPDNGHRLNVNKHWSEIPDFSSKSGDIKYVWEKSRFSYLLTVMRYDFHYNGDHSEFVFSEIENWIDANPVNQGPNWRCSQEISLRIFNWCFLLHFYKNSPEFTEERWEKIQHVIYWSLHHVYHHINFSRIAVRNNHAITETLFLALSQMLFSFIPETKKWASHGRKWFEKEVAYQIYGDGTFLQFSMNYHRVVIQLLSLGISIAQKNNQPFTPTVTARAYQSVNFLYQCLQEENGFLPNYGANDGAWFFPLSDTDYRDFRPQLNALHELLTGAFLFNVHQSMEESDWMGVNNSSISPLLPKIKKQLGVSEFPDGGYFLFREKDGLTFIKCGRYKDRPGHADNLHVDFWHQGDNLLCNGGSYKYNTEDALVKYFTGTESHNTVMLDHHDQMLKGPRFIWLNWSQAIDASVTETDTHFIFSGTVRCFTHLDKKIIHKRSVIKTKGCPEWKIKDEIINKPQGLNMRQLWHTPHNRVHFISEGLFPEKMEGWQSLYYGVREKTTQVEFVTSGNTIETTITFK